MDVASAIHFGSDDPFATSTVRDGSTASNFGSRALSEVAAQADDVSSLVKADIFALRASRSDFDPSA